MIITLTIPASTQRVIERHAKAAGRAEEAISAGLHAAVVVGADQIREALVMGQLGLTMQRPGQGLAASIDGWMIEPLLGAVGVPSDSPAAAYAGILETGGVVTPKNAKALAIPVSEEAKQYSSPRDMPGLFLVAVKGKAPILARSGGGDALEVHWVLVQSVTIPAFRWLTKGATLAKGAMTAEMQIGLNRYAQEWKGN